MADEFDPNKIIDLSEVREDRSLRKVHRDLGSAIQEDAQNEKKHLLL